MKVLMICTEKLPVPPVRGGAIQTYLAAVAPLLVQQHELTILGVQDPELPDRSMVGGIRYVRVPGGLLETYSEGVAAFLKSERFDLIHLFNRPRLVRVVRSAAPGARIVLSMHNDMFGPLKIDPEEGAAAVAAVSRIVTVSDYVGRTLSTLFPAAGPKLKTIYSGVDLKRFAAPGSADASRARADLRRVHGLEGKRVILFVGRLSPKKGADVLVRAMEQVHRKHPNAALVLVGSKWYGEDSISDYVAYVRALAARAPVPVVTTGFVAPEEVHRWFAAGDLFVCPSVWAEPLARVHYEAMAAGLPIITTARGGNPEVVEGAGNGVVVADPEEPRAMAEAITDLLNATERAREMGRRARSLAEQRYGWARVAAEILAVWAEPTQPEGREQDPAPRPSLSNSAARWRRQTPQGGAGPNHRVIT